MAESVSAVRRTFLRVSIVPDNRWCFRTGFAGSAQVQLALERLGDEGGPIHARRVEQPLHLVPDPTQVELHRANQIGKH